MHELDALNEGIFSCFISSVLNCGLPVDSSKSIGLNMYWRLGGAVPAPPTPFIQYFSLNSSDEANWIDDDVGDGDVAINGFSDLTASIFIVNFSITLFLLWVCIMAIITINAMMPAMR